MVSQNMFSSEVELGKFLGSIDIIPDAYQEIDLSETSETYKLHTNLSGIQVLAFQSPTDDYTTRSPDENFDLVSSENVKVVDFISTKVNPKFRLNKAAVELFEQLPADDLEKKIIRNSPLVITGQGLGGYRAVLFALWLQHVLDEKESNGSKDTIKRPICITFGCPLVGDAAFQKAISERPQWESSFLNVVAKKDLVASFFSSNSKYKPFGTFLFCTESGGHSAFEDQDSILAVLDAMRPSSNASNLDMYNYGNDLKSMKRKVLYRGVSESAELTMNSLKAGITLQFKEVGVLDDISNDLIEKMEDKIEKAIKKKKNAYEPTKKLNEIKISLTYMEWYMKTRKSEGGYYDSHKTNPQSREEIERQNLIVTHQRILNLYWKKFVQDKDSKPQKEGAKLRKRWLYGGTNYRRIVEPLDIADHYKKGKTNYMAVRPNHYKVLEKWSDEDIKEEKRSQAASLTVDSCFWARVEEALILFQDLRNGGLKADIEKEMAGFEDYVMLEIKKFAVSPDIFVKGSSFMKWWSEYKAYKGSSYASEFAKCMNNEIYISYQ